MGHMHPAADGGDCTQAWQLFARRTGCRGKQTVQAT